MSMTDPSDFERASARTKSYTTQAVITMLLYFVFWLPGLIANVLFLMDARRMQRIAGQSLSGVGCLWILLAIQIIPVLIACVIVAALAAGGGASS